MCQHCGLWFLLILSACSYDTQALRPAGSDGGTHDGAGLFDALLDGTVVAHSDGSSGGNGGTSIVGGSAGASGGQPGGTAGSQPACVPVAETCNGKDDDCDGMTDDNIGCRPLGDGCVANDQCGSAACVDGRCCERQCNSICDSCNSSGRCIKAPEDTPCGGRMCAPPLSDADRRSPSILANVCRAGVCVQVTKSCFGSECIPGGRPQGISQLNGCVMSGAEPDCVRINPTSCLIDWVCNAEGTTCVAPTK